MPEEYLLDLLAPFLEHRDSVRIQKSLDERGVLLSVTLHKDDMGMVIGHGGKTADAIRHIIRVISLKNGSYTSVKFYDNLTNTKTISA